MKPVDLIDTKAGQHSAIGQSDRGHKASFRIIPERRPVIADAASISSGNPEYRRQWEKLFDGYKGLGACEPLYLSDILQNLTEYVVHILCFKYRCEVINPGYNVGIDHSFCAA
jgi:hypothetical protein